MVKIIENVEKEAVEHSAVILATSTLIETKLKEIKQLNKDRPGEAEGKRRELLLGADSELSLWAPSGAISRFSGCAHGLTNSTSM